MFAAAEVDTIAARDINLYDNIFLTYARPLSMNHNEIAGSGDGGGGRAHCFAATRSRRIREIIAAEEMKSSRLCNYLDQN